MIIRNETVRKNVELFKSLISRSSKSSKKAKPEEKIYQAYLNRETGEISTKPESSESTGEHPLGALMKKNWKLISLQVRQDGAKGGKQSLEVPQKDDLDLQPLAHRIVMETMNTFNMILDKAGTLSDIDQVIEEVTHGPVSALSLSKSEVIIQTWRPLNRYEAEKVLLQEPEGSFFFRYDDYANELQEQLRALYGMPIDCYTLTFTDSRQKVSDRTVVRKGEQWLIYNDDLSLSGPFFNTIDDLLDSLVLINPISSAPPFSSEIMMMTWRPIDRFQAEILLLGEAVGSFFFRQDDMAKQLEMSLKKLFSQSIHCYTISFVSAEQRVSDMTIVKRGEEWLIYNDDLELNGPRFESVEALLTTLPLTAPLFK